MSCTMTHDSSLISTFMKLTNDRISHVLTADGDTPGFEAIVDNLITYCTRLN